MSKLLEESSRFSLYKNLYSVKPDLDINTNELYEIIKFGFLRKEIKALRRHSDKETRSDMKKSILPAVTLSGQFIERNEAGLKQHSGLLQIDFDASENYDTLFTKISADSYTYMAFRSSEGDKIHVVVKINDSKETHESQFFALKEYYQNTFSITIKTPFKEICRAMLLSFDPNIYCNQNSKIFTSLGIVIQEEPQLDSEQLKKQKGANSTLYKRIQNIYIEFSIKQETPAFMIFQRKVFRQLFRNTSKTKEQLHT